MGFPSRAHAMPASPLLIVFAKTPRPGAVKTRLCPPLRPREAKTLYRAFLEDLLARLAAADASWDGAIHVAPPVDRGLFRRLAPREWTVEVQRGKDLMERIVDSLGAAIAAGRPASCVVGSDVPLLASERIDEAFRKLRHGRVEAVLGEDRGGGYYLIGIRRGTRRGWRAAVREGGGIAVATRAALRRRGIAVGRLPVVEDCDLPGDLRRLAARLRRRCGMAPATGRVLRRLAARGRFVSPRSSRPV